MDLVYGMWLFIGVPWKGALKQRPTTLSTFLSQMF